MSASTATRNLPAVKVSPRLLRIKEAAEYLGASVWFVRNLIWEDKIPFLHLGQRFVIDRADLDAFVSANKQGAK